MARTSTNGNTRSHSNGDTRVDPCGNLIEQTDALKQTLKSAIGQVNDLIVSLKQQRKQAKTVQSTIAALRQLEHVA